MEGGQDRDRARVEVGHADAEVVARAEEGVQEGDDDRRAGDRAQQGVGDESLPESVERVRQFREAPARQPEGDRRDDDGDQGPRVESVESRDRDFVNGVFHAPGGAGEIADNAGDQHRNEGVVLHATDDEHLHGEDRACQRRAEHRTEAGGDAVQQQRAPVRVVDAEESPVGVGQAAAHLHRGALAPDRCTEEVREDRADEDERGHARRARRRPVHVVAPGSGCCRLRRISPNACTAAR